MHDHAPRHVNDVAPPSRRRATGPTGSAAELLRLQRTAGNAAVAGALHPSAQRAVNIDEIDTQVSPPAEQGTGGGTEGIRSEGGVVTIDGSMVTINAPIVRTDGIVQANTVIAQNVVGSSYTPGAGNVM